MGATHNSTWLMGQITGTWTADTRGGAQYSIAVQFHCNNAAYIDHVSWYAADTNTAHKPSHFDIYDQAGNTIWTTASLPHDGTIGWQDIALGGSLSLYAGQNYRLSACFPATCPDAHQTYVSTQATVVGVSWGNPVALEAGPGNCNRPDAGQNDEWRGLDCQFVNPPAAGAAGATIDDVDNELKTFLSSTSETNQHHTDLPWTTKSAVDTVSANVGTSSDTGATSVFGSLNNLANGLGSAAHGYFASIQGLINAIKTETDQLPTPISQLSSIVLAHYSSDITSILSHVDSVLTAANTSVAGTHFNTDVLAGRSGFPSGTPNTSWSMAAETDFTTELAWTVAADLYVVAITSVPAGVGTSSFAGLTFYHRLGSWCPLNASLGSSRRFLEFANQALDDGGRRMAGLALKCKQGTIGTVQAWTLA